MKDCTCPVCEAKKRGCRIEQANDRWRWSYGTHARSSNDHYGISFKSEMEAAVHFLKSREGLMARRVTVK